MNIETRNNNNLKVSINLKREFQLSDAAYAFKVYIDGSQVGRIRAGKTQTYEVYLGEHTVEVKHISYKKSLKIEAKTNDDLELRCGLNLYCLYNFNMSGYLVIEPAYLSSQSQITSGIKAHFLSVFLGFLIFASVLALIFYTWTSISLLITAFLLLVINTIAKNHFLKMSSQGMSPTLIKGDTIMIPKSSFEPHRGDIIFFEWEVEEGKIFSILSRIIGLPGEELSLEDGFVTTNREVHTRVRIEEEWQPFAIPDNAYFVLGDNQEEAKYDSRTLGFINREKIKGRVSEIVSPLKRRRVIPR